MYIWRRWRLVHKSAADPRPRAWPFFGGLQGIESLSGGLGRVGGSRSIGPRSVRLAVHVLCRIFFLRQVGGASCVHASRLRIDDAPRGSARGGGSEGESEEYQDDDDADEDRSLLL